MKPYRLWLYKLATSWLPETRCFGFKVALLRWAGAAIGSNVRIGSSVNFLGDGELVIGDDVWIGSGSFISSVGCAKIEIGSHVDIGPRVMLITGSHNVDPIGEHIGGDGISKSIKINDGCWIGAGAIIMPGVSLATKTLVAAYSLLNANVEAQCSLVAGIPAVVKKCYLHNS